MTKSELIRKLSAAGYHTAADYVRNEYFPGMVAASLDEIRDHFIRSHLMGPAKLIQFYLDNQYDA